MTTKRKAELQRKLGIAPVPKPPADLAERIKRDIPSDLRGSVERERERFKRSSLFSLRVAASILLLIGGAFIGVQLMSRAGAPHPSAAINMPTRAPAAATATVFGNEKKSVQVAQAPAAELPYNQVSVDSLQKAKGERQDVGRKQDSVSRVAGFAPQPQAVFPPPAEPKDNASDMTAEPAKLADEKELDEERRNRDRKATVVGGAAQQELGALRAAAAPASAAGAPVAKTAMAAAISVRSELFGISVDRQAFDRIKSAIERGERPTAAAVDVEALVNYFAGAPSRMRRDAALDLEASSRPVSGSTSLVRVTVDTSTAISDAKLEIAFDPVAVATHRRIGGDVIESATEQIVPASRSVTALYEVTLRPNVRPRQAIATAKLTYRNTGGKEQTLTRWVSYDEAVGPWSNRSTRHRVATLGAIWAETLRARANGVDVALKAAELSKQEPGDEKAKELAALATASSRLQSSSPTGSGR